MGKTSNIVRKVLAAALFLTVSLETYAAEVVYRIVEYNNTTGEFVLEASGMVPKGSWAYFENDYGATRGNRYNQIPRNRKAVLYLDGWKGCTLKSVTLSMCSNNKAGQAGLSVCDGDTPVYTERPSDFASDAWFGQWVSKDLNVYVDITKPLSIGALTSDEGSITIQGGTSEGSVYVNTITIDYEEPADAEMESPLGWIYEKLTKKNTLSDGDEVMIYRNGCAAADIDGIETAHYLDAVTIASTADVSDPEVLRFTIANGDGQNTWTMTDQHGRQLGATGKQSLAWDGGATQWSIELGYDGATITSSGTGYGSLRFNAPEAGYARFNVYTSTSLPLPFLYSKSRQKEAVPPTSLTFDRTEMTADIGEGHVVLRPTLLPTTTTDKRLMWTSSDDGVASVNGGYVTLSGTGHTVITAVSHDGSVTASINLTVTETAGITNVKRSYNRQLARKVLDGSNGIVITQGANRYGIDGRRF